MTEYPVATTYSVMQSSETTAKLNEALAKAQAAMVHASKSATNPHFKSRYADLAAVVDAVKEALSANGIAFIQGAENDGNQVAVTTRLAHASGEWLQSKLVVPVSKQDAQAYGSAITYARRYGLQAICGIAADDDDDGNAASARGPSMGRPQPSAPAQAPAPATSRDEVSRSEAEHVAKIMAAKTDADLALVRKSIPEPERTPAVRDAYVKRRAAIIGAGAEA